MKSFSLAELKHLLQSKTEKEYVPFSLVQGGIPKGAVTAVTGFGKTELVVQFLNENPTQKVAWIESTFSAFPFAFFQKNIEPSRVLFIEAGEDSAWACLQVLKSQNYPIVIIYADLNTVLKDSQIIRRLQLASEKAHACLLWLAPEHVSTWSVGMHLHVHRVQHPDNKNPDTQQLNVEIARKKL